MNVDSPFKVTRVSCPGYVAYFLCNRRKEESRSGLKYVGRNAVTHLIPKSLMTQTYCAQSVRSNRCLSNLGLQKRAWPTVQPPPAKTTLCSRTGSIQSVQQREVPHILFKPILWKIVEFGSSNHGNTSVCVPIVKSVRQDIMSGFMLFPQMSVPGMCSGGKSSAGRAGHQCGPRPMLDANFPKQFSSKHRFQSTIPGQTMRQLETWGTS